MDFSVRKPHRVTSGRDIERGDRSQNRRGEREGWIQSDRRIQKQGERRTETEADGGGRGTERDWAEKINTDRQTKIARHRARERQRQTETQRERPRQRQTETERDRDRDRKRHRERDRQRGRHRETDRETERFISQGLNGERENRLT